MNRGADGVHDAATAEALGEQGSPRGGVLEPVRLLDEMDEQMWGLLQRNLGGLTEAEADWRPHAASNSVRWMVGHLAWFEEWAHDALKLEGSRMAGLASCEAAQPDMRIAWA